MKNKNKVKASKQKLVKSNRSKQTRLVLTPDLSAFPVSKPTVEDQPIETAKPTANPIPVPKKNSVKVVRLSELAELFQSLGLGSLLQANQPIPKNTYKPIPKAKIDVDQSEAAKRAWIERRERYGSNGISKSGLRRIRVKAAGRRA